MITDLLPSWLSFCCLWLSSPLEKICMHRTPLSSWPLQGFSSRSTRTKASRRFTLQSCWWHQVWCSAMESSGCLFTGILLWLKLCSVISNTCVYLLLHIQKLAYSYFIHIWQQRQISTIFLLLNNKALIIVLPLVHYHCVWILYITFVKALDIWVFEPNYMSAELFRHAV